MTDPAAATLADVRVVDIQVVGLDDNLLAVTQSGREIPYVVRRVFTITAPEGTTRGYHAHRRQQQFLVCVSGAVEVVVDDGAGRRGVVLDSPGQGLYVPAGIWAEQTYRADASVLMVLCDSPYDEADYIRDRDQFRRFKTNPTEGKT